MRGLDARQRLTLIYVGLATFAFAMLFAQKAFDAGAPRQGQVHHGTALILEKTGGESMPRLLLRIRTGSGTEVDAEAGVEPEAWERLQVGERVGVVYRQNWSGSRVEVVETGLFALPPEHQVQ
jgi:hypothetical protein